MCENNVNIHTRLIPEVKIEPGLDESEDTQEEYKFNILNDYWLVDKSKEDLFTSEDLPSQSTHFKRENVEFPCELCGWEPNQSSQSETELENNDIDTEEKPSKMKIHTVYSCEHCGNLKTHIRIHTGETYDCGHCGKKFEKFKGLRRHLKVHTETKTYECKQCGKKFLENRCLSEHMRVHTGEKPYICEHCGKKFAFSSSWKRHVRIHTGEKPHKCEQCGQRFIQSSNLKAHVTRHKREANVVKKKTNEIECKKTY